MKRSYFFFLLLLLLTACQSQSQPEPTAAPSNDPIPIAQNPFADATHEPQMLAPGRISTQFNELNGALSPDGKWFFYSVDNPSGAFATILCLQLDADGQWQGPEVAPFSGKYSDVDPVFAPDGKRIYYCSNRPVKGGGPHRNNHDIWFVEWEGDAWGAPQHTGPTINTRRNDWYASSTADGVIYYSTWDSIRKTDDIFRATPGPDGYTVENVGDSINTGNTEYDPFIAPDGSYLLFSSYRRGNVGSSDIFISHWKGDHWTQARRLPEGINTEGQDYCPYVTADGKYFTFTRMHAQESYYPGEPWTWETLQARFETPDNGDGNVFYLLADQILAEE